MYRLWQRVRCRCEIAGRTGGVYGGVYDRQNSAGRRGGRPLVRCGVGRAMGLEIARADPAGDSVGDDAREFIE